MAADENSANSDNSEALVAQVKQAVAQQTPLRIVGGNTKANLGQQIESNEAVELSMRSHRGIIDYDPTELVVTVRSGTLMSELVETLDAAGQMLPFDPPQLTGSTIGGVLACGLSGPRRPFNGSARDYVLGTRVINGQAQDLSFGGQVMKNVAGYDVSRLQIGAWGTLGVLLDVSMKVLPKPALEMTLKLACEADELQTFLPLMRKSLPLSGAMQIGDTRYLRLSGSEAAVKSAAAELGGEVLADNDLWSAVRDHEHPFFVEAFKAAAGQGQALWRLSVADFTPALALSGDYLYEWAGAQRWLLSAQSSDEIYTVTGAAGGHATRYSAPQADGQVVSTSSEPAFQPLSGTMQRLQKRIRDSFDPQRLFNCGRFHPELDVASAPDAPPVAAAAVATTAVNT